ncbi:hypothetical protein H1C71_035018, partial [Ictidomys tridecemlineatus]
SQPQAGRERTPLLGSSDWDKREEDSVLPGRPPRKPGEAGRTPAWGSLQPPCGQVEGLLCNCHPPAALDTPFTSVILLQGSFLLCEKAVRSVSSVGYNSPDEMPPSLLCQLARRLLPLQDWSCALDYACVWQRAP